MRKIIILFAVFAALLGCSREIPNPVDNSFEPVVIGTPANLIISVGDGTLNLDWEMADSTGIVGYKIYRARFLADTLSPEYSFIDSTTDAEFADSNLQNGYMYLYKVSAFNEDRIEGNLSASANGVPNLYSLIIEGGETTNTRNVILTLVAPSNTMLMRISNTSDFANSPWESFANSKPWIVDEGAGLKTVYAMFRDNNSNNTSGYVSDDITYEILNYQYSIVVNNNAPKTYSREVDLTIGAPSGTSYMMISNSADFNNADWETFAASKLWFISRQTADNQDTAAFYAVFRDENGDSVEVMVSDSIMLASSDPVDLLPVYQEPDNYQMITLQWSASLSEDFNSYRLFRSNGANTVDTIIASFNDISQVSYIDSIGLNDLPDDAIDSVYYMLRFYSSYDDSSDSDTILVALENTQPPSVSCFISDVSYDSSDVDTLLLDLTAVIGWSASEIPDFSYYVVYEYSDDDSLASTPIAYVYDISSLSYAINKNGVSSGNEFYYWLRVFDRGGRISSYSAYALITVP
ncbi:MAG: fibronectin type III domain-containing protein [candidate division Zixibacteria bacterium]|nr:fibronectin type III domain-containing protein [candidate division Zixibacteria bacterium]